MQTGCRVLAILATSVIVAWVYVMGRIVGESFPKHSLKERFGLAIVAGLSGSAMGSIVVGLVETLIANWNVHLWMDFKAWTIVLVLSSGFGIWRGWCESQRTSN